MGGDVMDRLRQVIRTHHRKALERQAVVVLRQLINLHGHPDSLTLKMPMPKTLEERVEDAAVALVANMALIVVCAYGWGTIASWLIADVPFADQRADSAILLGIAIIGICQIVLEPISAAVRAWRV